MNRATRNTKNTFITGLWRGKGLNRTMCVTAVCRRWEKDMLSLQCVQPYALMFSPVAVIHTEPSPSITQCVCHNDQRGVCVWGEGGVFLPCLLLYTYESPWQQSHRPAACRFRQRHRSETISAGEIDMIGWSLSVQNIFSKRSLTIQSQSLSPTSSTSIQSLLVINPLSLFTSKHWWEIMLE